jgi:hypothetical protein
VALSQARILYQNHSGDYPQVILTIPVTCRTVFVSYLPYMYNVPKLKPLFCQRKLLIGIQRRASVDSRALPAVMILAPGNSFQKQKNNIKGTVAQAFNCSLCSLLFGVLLLIEKLDISVVFVSHD